MKSSLPKNSLESLKARNLVNALQPRGSRFLSVKTDSVGTRGVEGKMMMTDSFSTWTNLLSRCDSSEFESKNTSRAASSEIESKNKTSKPAVSELIPVNITSSGADRSAYWPGAPYTLLWLTLLQCQALKTRVCIRGFLHLFIRFGALTCYNLKEKPVVKIRLIDSLLLAGWLVLSTWLGFGHCILLSAYFWFS